MYKKRSIIIYNIKHTFNLYFKLTARSGIDHKVITKKTNFMQITSHWDARVSAITFHIFFKYHYIRKLYLITIILLLFVKILPYLH